MRESDLRVPWLSRQTTTMVLLDMRILLPLMRGRKLER